jgi:hypothetical protein
MTKASLHRFSHLPRRFLVSLGLGVGILTVGAIAPVPTPLPDQDSRSLPTPQTARVNFVGLSVWLSEADILWQSPIKSSAQPLTVNLFTPTETCETFQGHEQKIAADQAIPQIVHLLLTEQTPNLLDFELAGYRLQTSNQGNHVTIDFRRKPGAKRHFISLSLCEQLVLFGSLRKTLLENPQLHIREVEFTERGRPIML